MSTKVVFFGTPDFSVPFLSALIEDQNLDVVAVVCQPDKPVGRKGTVTPPAIKTIAIDNGIAVIQPKSLKNDETLDHIRPFEADLFVVVAYGKIIPQAVLDIPKLGSINVHPSLLPEYRGPAPMQAAIAEGDDQTGVSIMLLDAGMDTGPILAQEVLSLDADETYGSLVGKVHQMGPRLLVSTIKRYIAGDITPLPQDHNRATLTSLLKREDGHIDWTAPLIQLERKIRAYDPWPGTWTMWNNKRIKILKARESDFKADVPPGTVTVKENQLFVDCYDGTLQILELQLEGKPAMSTEAFMTGNTDIVGSVLH